MRVVDSCPLGFSGVQVGQPRPVRSSLNVPITASRMLCETDEIRTRAKVNGARTVGGLVVDYQLLERAEII
jgi:hypothetical protein